jgi:hypothetical protein
VETLAEKLALIERHISRAVTAVTADSGASPVLRAVVNEFAAKSFKARSGAYVSREGVVELEQAADSARVAAAADAGAAPETRKLVNVAHDAICLLKAESAPH